MRSRRRCHEGWIQGISLLPLSLMRTRQHLLRIFIAQTRTNLSGREGIHSFGRTITSMTTRETEAMYHAHFLFICTIIGVH